MGIMKLSEALDSFEGMPVCDRLYLICQLLQKCVSYELAYIRSFLLGNLSENLSSLSTPESLANKMDFITFNRLSLEDEVLDKVICSLSLLRYDNRPVAQKIFSLLSERQILVMAEENESEETLNKLRLLYVLAVYHPALSFSQQNHLLTIFLRHLDELYELREREKEKKKEEAEAIALAASERPSIPSDDAVITQCELKGVYKRQSDKRYPYILEVGWSNGACCHIQRTYGDFFSFQNKLLDIFPEESGQRSKKQRVIPFLPGRKLLSGRTNRELAEKRLPDLWQYTHDLFMLPQNISQCKHVLDFFRPRSNDVREEVLSTLKITTLADVKNNKPRGSGHSVAFLSSSSPSSSPSRPHSAIQTVLNSASSPSGRGSNTLPAQQSPAQKDSGQINRRSTYPARPSGTSAFTVVTPTGSTEKLHSSSQTSITSSEVVLPTTVACHVVTPPTSRSNGSPAFSVSNNKGGGGGGGGWDSESPTIIKFVRSTSRSKGGGGKEKQKDDKSSSSSLDKSATLTHQSANASWADRCESPPVLESSLSPFQTITHQSTPYTQRASNAPSSAPPERVSVPFSPSLPQLHQYTPTHGSPYPVSYTPTHFDTPSPKPVLMSGRTPGTPTTEQEHFKKWLKCHRLHKYDNLFSNMSFEEVIKLTVEELKGLGMTQGAAKKLTQKLKEQITNGALSFRDMPIPSISRRPSTTSLPTALLLERQQLTPSSSIDQLSLHGGSTCSLDVLGHSFHHTTPKHLHRHSDSLSDATTIDTAILEAGPTSSVYARGGVEGEGLGSRMAGVNGQSRLSYTSSPLHWVPTGYVATTPTDKETDEISPRQNHSHKRDPEHQPRLPHPLMPPGAANRIQGVVTSNWPHPLQAPPPVVPPQVVRGIHRTGQSVLTYANINGLIRSSPVLHSSPSSTNRYSAPPIQQSLVSPPIFYSSSSRSPGPSSSSSCFNCGSRGHQGLTCPLLYTSPPPPSSAENSALLRS